MTEVESIKDPYRIVFPKLDIDVSINPTAFSIFGFDIQWYGIIITFGLILAMFYCFSKMKRFGIDSNRAIDAVIGGIIGGIIGARLYFVIFSWNDYKDNLKEIFNTRNGGLAIYGGLIGAVLVGGIICKLKKVRLLPMLDVAVLGFLIGQGIGRWGNFVNQEAFGTNTDCIFGMTGGTIQSTIVNEMAYQNGSMFLNGLEMSEKYAVHPCFLYESFWCILGFILLSIYSKHRKFDGQLTLMYVFWYGLGRFFIEGLRTDSLMLGRIRASQALAGILALTSLIFLIVVLAKYKRLNGDGFELYCNTEESKRLIEESEQMLADEKENHKGSSDEAYENIIDESTDEIKKNENSDDISTKKTEKTEEE